MLRLTTTQRISDVVDLPLEVDTAATAMVVEATVAMADATNLTVVEDGTIVTIATHHPTEEEEDVTDTMTAHPVIEMIATPVADAADMSRAGRRQPNLVDGTKSLLALADTTIVLTTGILDAKCCG